MRNCHGDRIYQIVMVLHMPPEITLIHGESRIEVDDLAAEAEHRKPMEVLASHSGSAEIVYSVHYIAPNGSKIKHSGQTFAITVLEPADPGEICDLTIMPKIFTVDQWNTLEGQLCWHGSLPPGRVSLQAAAPFEGGETAGLEQPVVVGAVRSFAVSLRPRQSGEKVPLRLSLHSPSGMCLYKKDFFLKVENPPTQPVQRIVHIYGDGLLTFADGSTIQQNISAPPMPGGQPSSTHQPRTQQEPQMNPIELILTAITQGAAAGFGAAATALVTTAAQDLYNAMKAKLTRHLAKRADAKTAFDMVEKDPKSAGRKAMLAEELTHLEVAQDQELLQAAQDFLAAYDPQGKAAGKYTIDARYSTGANIGDNNTITQNFYGDKPKP